jgi:type IV secretory pathway TrbD component
MRRIAPTPVPAGLVQPSIWWGCNPAMLIGLGFLCVLLAGVAFAYNQFWLIPFAAFLFALGRMGLVALAKVHPQQHLFLWRALGHARFYDACGRWDERPRRARKWV